MLKLSLETVLELAGVVPGNPFQKAVNQFAKVKEVPFYGPMYNVTYNEMPANVDEYVEIIKAMKRVGNCDRVAECFAGNGIESFLLSNEFVMTKFDCFDIDFDPYDRKFTNKNLDFKKINCIQDEHLLDNGMYDLTFTGSLNASNCCVPSLDDFASHMAFASRITREGGKVIFSFFDSSSAEDVHTLRPAYSKHKIVYNEKYKGNYVHWLNLVYENQLEASHTYYDLALIVDEKGNTVDFFFCPGYTTKSYNTHWVIATARKYDLHLDPLTMDLDTKILVFTKK